MGFLGSILCPRLIEKGHKVRILDSLFYPSELTQNPNIEFIKADIRNLVDVARSLKDIDTVIHLAGIVGKDAITIDPKTSIEINYLATKNLAELCHNRKITNLIFASTCSVYGSQKGKLVTEKTSPQPLEAYAQSKFDSEKALQTHHHTPTILRFATLFGYSPRMRFDLLINLFIAKALLHEPITIYGGHQIRPFLHVSDCADSIIFALDHNLEGIYNVVSENMTLSEIGTKIARILDTKIIIDKSKGDLRDYQVSIQKINTFGYSPKRSLEFGITEIQKFFDKNDIDYKDPKYQNSEALLFKNVKKRVFI